MNFSPVPSLQNMAATWIVTFLWNQGDVVALVAEYDDYDDTECDECYRGWPWLTIKHTVDEKVLLLCQPAPLSLREKLLSLVMPIGDQIWKWIGKHVQCYKFQNIPREFCWTSLGTVDKKETAKVFVHDPTLPEGERYGMACLYCLEWNNPVPFHVIESHDELSTFLVYWTYDRTGDATALDSTLVRDTSKTPCQCAFEYAVKKYNKVAAQYYLNKLTPGERKESLSDIVLYRHLADFDLCRFLLLNMDEGQRSKLLEKYAEVVLKSLLEWPWQPFFMDVAHRVRDVLEGDEYSYILLEIVDKIMCGFKDYSYGELLRALWVQIPVAHRKYVMRDHCLLWKLFRVMGENNMSLMLKDWSPEEREQILFSDLGIQTCGALAYHDEWDVLRSFIGECTTSCDKIIHLKQEYKRRGHVCSNEDEFFQFLDEVIEKFSKRGGEEADCPVQLLTNDNRSGLTHF